PAPAQPRDRSRLRSRRRSRSSRAPEYWPRSEPRKECAGSGGTGRTVITSPSMIHSRREFSVRLKRLRTSEGTAVCPREETVVRIIHLQPSRHKSYGDLTISRREL